MAYILHNLSRDEVEHYPKKSGSLFHDPDNLDTRIVNVDVGCKFGIHPASVPIKDLCDHYLLDADESEVQRLKQHYSNHNNIDLDCYFVGRNSKRREQERLFLYSHSGGHSKYLPDSARGYWKNFRKGSGTIVGEKIVPKISLDEFSQSKSIQPDFLKIDVEGAELEVLEGAEVILSDSVLGVRIEVELNPLYKNQEPTYGEVNKRLREKGFEFLFFDKFFTNSYTPFSNFFVEEPYGQLVGADAIYVLSPDEILNRGNARQVLDYAIFCFCNKATDLGMHILVEGVEQKIYNAEEWKHTKRYKFLEKNVATLLFNLQDKPGNSLKEFSSLWKKIFASDWIDYGDFYKRFPLT